MSRHAMRHPERYEVRIDSPFDCMIPTKLGCLDCGAELTETKDGDFVCLNCQADEAIDAHTGKEYKNGK